MHIRTIRLKAAFISLAIALSGAASAQTLTTPQLGGNENDGVMFDVHTGASALTLTALGANIFGTASYSIFYRAGTINDTITSPPGGNVSDPSAWTSLGNFTDVVGIGTLSAQPGGLVAFDIADVALAANSTYGLYITQTVNNFGLGSGVRFTNSVLGSTVASDGNLTILNSRGASYAFNGISRNGRSFNGSLSYTLGGAVPEPATWAMMLVGFAVIGATMRRRTPRLARAVA